MLSIKKDDIETQMYYGFNWAIQGTDFKNITRLICCNDFNQDIRNVDWKKNHPFYIRKFI